MSATLAGLVAAAVLGLAAPASAGVLLERGYAGPIEPVAIFKRAHRREFGVVTARVSDPYEAEPASVRLWRVRPSGRRAAPRPREITPPGVGTVRAAAVAYDANRDRYLEVVTTDKRLIAQRLSGTGRRIGRPFSLGGRSPWAVRLLYVPSKRRYLLAWSEHADERVRLRALGRDGRPTGSVRMPLGNAEPHTVRIAVDPRRSGAVATFGTPHSLGAFARRLHTDGRGARKRHRVTREGAIGGLGYSPAADAFVAMREGTSDASTVLVGPDARRRAGVNRVRARDAEYGSVLAGEVVGRSSAVLVTWSDYADLRHQGEDFVPFARRLDAEGRRPTGRLVRLRAPRLPDAQGTPLAARAARGWLVTWPVAREVDDPYGGPPDTYATEWGIAIQVVR